MKHSSDFIGELQVEDLKTKEIQHYQSMSCHFHSKSEHLFDGVQYDAECHIVFVKKEVPEQTDKTVDVLCVLGVLIKIDDENAKESNSKIITDFSPNDPQVIFLCFFILSIKSLLSLLISINCLGLHLWQILSSITIRVH